MDRFGQKQTKPSTSTGSSGLRGPPERRRPASIRNLPRPKEIVAKMKAAKAEYARKDSEESDKDAEQEQLNAEALIKQNYELRQRLEEEASNYKRRLDTYRQAQQHQAALVSRLQAKVLQYKQRCSELEGQMSDTLLPTESKLVTTSLPSQLILQAAQQTMQELREEQISDLDTALRRLNEERTRCEKLLKLNVVLKEQLEESHRTNETLTSDLQKLSSEWDALREEMSIKEEEWKDEEMAFNDYYMSEHNRLLNIKRDVTSIRKLFSDTKFATERDLSKLKNELSNAVNDIVMACSNTSFLLKIQAAAASTIFNKGDVSQAASDESHKSELIELKSRLDEAWNELKIKDNKIGQLTKEVQSLEEKLGESETNVTQSVRMHEEIEILQNALRDIAYALIQDAEMKEIEASQNTHLHLTTPTSAQTLTTHIIKRPQKGASIPAFAESTISAVQAALHKYQLTIHELQTKLQTSKEQLGGQKKQIDGLQDKVLCLESSVAELLAQLDNLKSHNLQISQEKQLIQRTLDSVKSEKACLDRNRIEYANAVDNLNSENDKLEKMNIKLEKLYRNLEDEKAYLQNELERLTKDCELRETSLRIEEERSSKLREELLILREDLNKAYLTRDVLEQQKFETENYLLQVEKNKGDLELEMDRILMGKSELEEQLMKMKAICSNSEQEIERLQDELKKINEEKTQLINQCTDQQNDLGSLKKELLSAEQTRLDLESEKLSLTEKLKFLEMEKEKVELELAQITREKGDLSNQLSILSRKKEAFNEELMRLRQRLEQAVEMNARLNRNLEELVKDNEEKQVLLMSSEKDNQRLQEQFVAMRTEKDNLEGILYDTQSNLEATHAKKTQLEKEYQELLVKCEGTRGEVARLTKDLENFEKRSREEKQNVALMRANQEAEYQSVVLNLKKQSEEAVKKLTEEKENIKATLESKLQRNLSQLEQEKDNEIAQLSQRVEELQQHLENLCQQHEEVLLRAENDKQQALLIAHHDQQALLEKLESVYRELEGEKVNIDRIKRETANHAEQDRNTLNQLRDELNRIKTKLDETKMRSDEEKLKLELKMDEIRNERDSAQKEAEELQVQHQMAEDKVEDLQNQLQETNRKIRDGELTNENLRKEIIDIRRQLADSNCEKDKYGSSNKELRERIKEIESKKREQARALEDVYQKVTALEDAKEAIETERSRIQTELRDSEREVMQLQHKVKVTQEELEKSQNANNQAANNEKELQARLANEQEERERLQLQLHQMKKQIVDMDNSLEITRQELGKMRARADDEDERWRAREQELLCRLEDARCRERKLEDQKHNLEVCIADATQQVQELKARLGGSEGRVRALDCQLSQMESIKKELEQKLSCIGLILRRVAGIQLDGSCNVPVKLTSPSRRWSPVRYQEHSDSNCEVIQDVDPEAVRKGVRSLMQQVAQIERERDDFELELNGLRKQLVEAQSNQGNSDSKINALLANLRAIQDEKCTLETRLVQKEGNLQNKMELLQQREDELARLREKIATLESCISHEYEQKTQLEEKYEKAKQTIMKLEAEKRCLQEDLGKNEGRLTKMELQRMSLEGDLQRIQMHLQEKESTIQKLQERCDTQARTISSFEERCISLKTTIDQLNLALDKSSIVETELKAEIQSLQRSLMESSAHSHGESEKVKMLQKQLSTAESERRILSERLDALQLSINELRHQKQILSDENVRMKSDLANAEVERSALESQLRLSNWSGEGSLSRDEDRIKLQACQRDHSELKEKVDLLNEKIKQLEGQKKGLERQVTTLRSSSLRSKSFERSDKAQAEIAACNYGIEQLEQENRELKSKIRRMENQLTDKESETLRLKASHSHSQSMLEIAREKQIDIEKYRAAQLQAEKILESKEHSYRQQVMRLEHQILNLREQLNQEIKRRQLYVLRTSRTGREMQQIRQALGDSLKTIAQDPTLDAVLLQHEARKLDSTVNNPISLPPSLALPSPSSSSYSRKSPLHFGK